MPRIHFAAHGSHLLKPMPMPERRCSAWTTASRSTRPRRARWRSPLQGNIDPALLTAPWETLGAHVDDVLHRGEAAPGHVVNLGHGVPPDTDPDALKRIVDHVHENG